MKEEQELILDLWLEIREDGAVSKKTLRRATQYLVKKGIILSINMNLTPERG